MISEEANQIAGLSFYSIHILASGDGDVLYPSSFSSSTATSIELSPLCPLSPLASLLTFEPDNYSAVPFHKSEAVNPSSYETSIMKSRKRCLSCSIGAWKTTMPLEFHSDRGILVNR